MTLKPVTSPQELRERLVKFYMGSFERAYGGAERTTIERKVIADLEYVDAAKRFAPRAPTRTEIDPAVLRERATRAAALDKQQDVLDKRLDHPERYRPAFFHRNPMLISETWARAVARLARILEGTWGSDLTKAVENAALPKLAAEFLELYAFYMTRGKAPPSKGVDHNPFRHLSDQDASRMFMAKAMDICDKSTGSSLGAWRTPK